MSRLKKEFKSQGTSIDISVHTATCNVVYGELNVHESSFMILLQFTEKAVHASIRQNVNVIYTRNKSNKHCDPGKNFVERTVSLIYRYFLFITVVSSPGLYARICDHVGKCRAFASPEFFYEL